MPIACHFQQSIKYLRTVVHRTLRGIGFDVLKTDSEGLRNLLSEIVQQQTSTQSISIAPNLFGYLARHPVPELRPLKDLLSETLSRLLPTNAKRSKGAEFSGRALAFNTAQKRYMVPIRLLEAYARNVPGLAMRLSQHRTSILIDRDVADACFLGRTPFLRSMTLEPVFGKMLPHTRSLASIFTAANVINASPPDPVSRALPGFYSLPKVRQDMSSFLAIFPRAEAAPGDLVPLRYAQKRCAISLERILVLLREKKLRRVVRIDGPPLDAIYLDPSEVRAVSVKQEGPFNTLQVAALLSVRPEAVTFLLNQGYLNMADKGSQHGMSGRSFEPTEISSFQAKYMSLTEASSALGVPRFIANLKRCGLEPKILHSKRRVYFYLREEVERSARLKQ